MADYTPEQLERMIASLRDSAGTMAKAASSMSDSSRSGGRDSSLRQLRSDLKARTGNFNYAVDNFTNNLRDATSNAERFGRWFDRFLRSGIGLAFGGALTTQLITSVRDLNDTYKELNERGQTFSGSMFEMARQAGAASLSLEQFADLITKFSNAAAVLGRQVPGGLPALSHAVRMGARNFSMFGYSVEQLNEITGEYAETLRLQGLLTQGFDITQASQQILAMAENAATFSNLTGRLRSEITKQVNEALRDVLVTSRTQSQISEQQRAALNRSVAFLASIPGDAGRVMSTFLAQSFGAGSALYAEQAQRFSEAGFGQAISMMDRLRARIEAGEDQDEATAEYVQEFVAQVDAANEGLRLQALAGNQAARELLRMRDEMRAQAQQSAADRAKAREEARVRAGLTSFASRFTQTFNEIMGAFRAGFWDQIEDLDRALAGFLTPGGGIEALKKTFENVGKAIGDFVTRVLTPDNILKMGNAIEGLVGQIGAFLEATFSGMTAQSAGDTLALVFRGAVMVAEGFVGLLRVLESVVRFFEARPLGPENAQGQDRAWYDKTIGEWAVMVAAMVAGGWAIAKVFSLVSGLAGGVAGAFRGLTALYRGGTGAVAGAAGVADDVARAAGDRAAGAVAAADDVAAAGARAAGVGAAGAADDVAAAGARAAGATGLVDDAARAAATVGTAGAAAAGGAAARPAVPTAAATGPAAAAGGIGRYMPGVGMALGAYSAGQRASGGDYVGAAIDLAAGAASFVPKFGTAAALGLAGVNMARDAYGRTPQGGPTPEEQAAALEMDQRRLAEQIAQNRAQADRRQSRGRNADEHLARIEQLMEQQLQLTVQQNRMHNQQQRDQIRALGEISTGGTP
jgi:hypothetical protein